MNDKLPTNIHIRPATMADLSGVTDLIRKTDIAERGATDFTADQILEIWQQTEFHLETDAWVAVDHSNETSGTPPVVGYEEIWNRSEYSELHGDGYVHPDYTGLGIGTALLHRMDSRGRQMATLAPNGKRVYIRNGVSGSDTAARQLHEHEGYQLIRYFWRMEVDLLSPPPEPIWPAGLQMEVFSPDMDPDRLFAAMEDAFRDHWGYQPWDYEFLHKRMQLESFDPNLWFFVWEGEQIAGGALCSVREQIGWVNSLGVRQGWRKRGLGLALLQHAFDEFYRREIRQAALNVDAANPTGATRLYQRAGMQVAHEYLLYEKVLQPGVEP